MEILKKAKTLLSKFRKSKQLVPTAEGQAVALPLKKSKRELWREYGYLAFCFLIPAILVYLMYFAREIHPFGDGCVLVLDLNGQYVWFFEALRNFVHGDAELLYSFSRALGGEFLGIYAYYLASPLSYLVCLFPEDRMLEALLTLFMLKASLCGLTFGYYMHRTLKETKRLSIVLFSSFYALCSYAIVQQNNTMWIDALIWLPLITLGIESVIKYGKFKLYTVSLSVALFSNYYIGWMLCIYCLIYFFLYYFAHAEEYRNNPLHEKLHFLRSLLRMTVYSLLALGMAALILFAAFYSLNFGKTTFSDPSWEVLLKFDIIEFLYKLLPSSYDTVRPDGLPFIYCGMLTILLIPAYFLSKKYSMQQKIFSALLIIILFASFSINVVDLVWHGFQNPNWLNHRYSFMLSFYLCVLACRAFADFENVSLKATMVTGGFVALLCVILQTYTSGEYVDPDDFTCIYFSLILIFIYLAVLAILQKAIDKAMVSAVLVGVVCIELFLNGLWNLNALDEDVGYSRYSYYNNFLDKTRPIVETVQEMDTSFYRMEKTFFRKTNDNMALGMRGLSGSTSTLNKETIKLLNKMGYSSKSHWSKYLGGTPVSDSLLGLKYIISDQTIYDTYYDVYAKDEQNGYTAYYNPYALSIAYGVDDDILDFPLGFVESEEVEEEDEEEENSAVSDAVDALKNMLNQWLDIEENNLSEYEDGYNSPFERLNAMVTAMLGAEETVEIFVPIPVQYTDTENLPLVPLMFLGGERGYKSVTNPDEDGIIYYGIEIPVDAEIFFYVPTNYPREVKLAASVDGSAFSNMGTFNGNETTRIISLGLQEADTELELRLTLTKDQFYYIDEEEYFYYIDWTVFEDAMERLAEDQYEITEYTESSFKGNFTASRENELVLTTIAYDNGWNVYVDGEKVEITKALGGLLSFHIDGAAGETHTLELVYAPKTIAIGFIISIVSIAIFILLLVLDHFYKFGCKDRREAIVVADPKEEPALSDEEGDDSEAEAPEEEQAQASDTSSKSRIQSDSEEEKQDSETNFPDRKDI